MEDEKMSLKKREAQEWMLQIEPEPSHVEQVARLACRLFDELEALHQLGAEHREWLEIAGWLHDIGWVRRPNGKGHHKASAAMILERKWIALSQEETLIISQIARYHRKALPQQRHLTFWSFELETQQTVQALASILRIADALDHGHLKRVAQLDCVLADDELLVRVQGREKDLETEIKAFNKKKDLAEQFFGRPVRIEVVPGDEIQ